jgi:hypothetical protein
MLTITTSSPIPAGIISSVPIHTGVTS